LRDLGLRDANDSEIFFAARVAGTVVMTKDSDFVTLIERHGAPPSIIWLTCGNTSNVCQQEILRVALPQAITLLESGEHPVEIRAAR
jgi:predicted nuclease of predicted toxin-antitoxin system